MSKVATLRQNPATNKWEASYQGRVFLKSLSKDYVVDKIVNGISEKAKALGITQVSEADVAIHAAQVNTTTTPDLVFGINERFEILEDFIDMVATRTIPSVVVTGTGGLGKSHTVMKALKKAGLTKASLATTAVKPKSIDPDDEDGDDVVTYSPVDIEKERKSFVVVKGFSTAKALFRMLFENRHKIIVFDDTDVTKDPVAVDILKAALDSYDERIVTWGAEGFIDDGLPRSFEFCGGVILISNKPMFKIPQPLISRSLPADVSMTRMECVERMRNLVTFPDKDDEFLPEYSQDAKLQALEFIEQYADHRQVKSVNMRTLIGVTKALVAKPLHWERLALYAMINTPE